MDTPKSEASPSSKKLGGRSIILRANLGLNHSERFYADPTGTIRSGVPNPFSQLVTSSLKRYGGDVAEEYLRELQGSRGVQIYKEMGNDAIVAATLSAVKMTLRRVTWFADDNPKKKKNKTPKTKPDTGSEDKEFLESCISDMSVSWSDFIDQALSMLQFGYAPFEVVYKVRRGNTPRPGPRTAKSKYDDGKIGWRKFVFIGQDTLVPGNSWIFDDKDGSLKGLNQQPPVGAPLSARTVAVPIEKMILFRTTTERDNPEGRSILRPMYKCFSEDTELLTYLGWKTVNQIDANDEVATLNPETEELEYQKPDKIWSYNYDGDMLHARAKHVDQLVTPNHRMWVRRARKKTFEFISAEDCTPFLSFLSTANWSVPDLDTIRVGEQEIPADLWFEFLGYWLSEGHAGKYGRRHSVGLTQKEGEVAELIRGIVEQLPWSVYEKTDNRGIVKWEFTRKELWEHLSPLGKATVKRIPRYVLNGSSRQLGILLESYWLGDGSTYGNLRDYSGTKVIATMSRGMADDLMEVILKAGHRPSLRWQKGVESNKFGNSGIWLVTIGKKFHEIRAKWSTEKYNGLVWCVTTKNGIVYTRRNGKCTWSGNSYYYKINLEEIEAISAERLGAGFPVIYLGDDVAKGDGTDADFAEFQKIARNIRVDEQMGLVIPFAKMGQGMAREGSGVLVELLSPPARGNIDFSTIIQRYEKRIAMVGLAQFIHLGMDQQGSQALAEVTTDFFQLAVSAWADSLQDTVNRFLVEPLFRLNGISNEDHPVISRGDISTPNLKDIGDYINKTVGAQVITPDDKLEETLRRVAGFPDKDDATSRPVMNEQDGDGGQRIGRTEKAKSANNQRNQNPTAEKPREVEKPEAKKPMRASEEVNSDKL